MAAPFSLSSRAPEVSPGCKAKRVDPTLRQNESRSRLGVRSQQRNHSVSKHVYIVGHENCCLQRGIGLSVRSQWRQQLTCPTTHIFGNTLVSLV
ncbi:hypothetical protein PoB_002901900 [Plakobranchus ocellatus]|uniref:Uncharacterized protein n=1 Tax=Plakobranchus ocellatus TaxID=259542 RepID=A0AAV4A7M1_9GAST|nr:hypothetical protein PoB_002901900 [Plakobranchus ocellatus]